MENKFLPISMKDLKERGWDGVDFVLVSGDAYVDHPSFGPAIIGRVLERYGYKVGIVAQPDWKNEKDFKRFGKPRLGFLVSAGNMDSMVNHYTVNRKKRKTDAYSPGGQMGMRPDRATIVYCNKIREIYGEIPIVIGGVEASLRRFAHYDYWEDRIRNSILIDTAADLIIYGMGEKPVVEVAECLAMGMEAKYIRHVQGTCYRIRKDQLDEVYDYVEVESLSEIKKSKEAYARAFNKQNQEQNPFIGKALIQRHGDSYIVQNPPAKPLETIELDDVYELPYQRTYHPIYEKSGGIPALKEVEFSLSSSRGCYGGCSFCAITFHQGRIVQGRSHESLEKEADKLIESPNFKGYIHDVGGPTANFRKPACKKQMTYGACKNKQCLFPEPCSNLEVDHEDYIQLLRKIRKKPKIKKVFIRSGIRYDYVVADKNKKFLKELCEHHVSGLLKVAPEHIDPKVLKLMGKPNVEVFEKFTKDYKDMNKKLGKDQYLVPYLISSHPGSTLKSAIKLACYLKSIGYIPEQVQDFYPTPGTLSAAMYYTELNPVTLEKIYVPKTKEEKHMQRALLQFNRRENYKLVRQALISENRYDLIGNGPKCLIRDFSNEETNKTKSRGAKGNSKSKYKKNNRHNAAKNNKKEALDLKSKKRYNVMLLMVLIIGFSIGQIAVFANGGSEKDPLITMSYMNQKIEQLKYYVDSKVDGGETLENKQSSAWEVVKLAKGQSIVGESSTEFILRSGKGTAIASASGGLCDVTIGKDLSKGVNIEKNHLLIVPRSDGRGILASSEIYIMVKGNYQIIQ